MSKIRSFRVQNGRALFKCHACKTGRMYAIPPGVRTRTLRCFKCGETTRCIFNRRVVAREQQSGRILLFCDDGKEVEVDLYDISLDGLGFEIPIRDMMRIAVGKQVYFKCPWNPQLISQGRYIIRSIKGQRVGAERVG